MRAERLRLKEKQRQEDEDWYLHQVSYDKPKPGRSCFTQRSVCYPELRGKGATAFYLMSSTVYFVLSYPGEATGDRRGASSR